MRIDHYRTKNNNTPGSLSDVSVLSHFDCACVKVFAKALLLNDLNESNDGKEREEADDKTDQSDSDGQVE